MGAAHGDSEGSQGEVEVKSFVDITYSHFYSSTHLLTRAHTHKIRHTHTRTRTYTYTIIYMPTLTRAHAPSPPPPSHTQAHKHTSTSIYTHKHTRKHTSHFYIYSVTYTHSVTHKYTQTHKHPQEHCYATCEHPGPHAFPVSASSSTSTFTPKLASGAHAPSRYFGMKHFCTCFRNTAYS